MGAHSRFERLPEVDEFLTRGPLTGVVGGQAATSSSGELFTTRDPGSGETLAEVHAMQPDDVDRAVRAAAAAFVAQDWAGLTAHERGALLYRLADEVERRRPILAQLEALDCGKVYAQAEGDKMLAREFRPHAKKL